MFLSVCLCVPVSVVFLCVSACVCVSAMFLCVCLYVSVRLPAVFLFVTFLPVSAVFLPVCVCSYLCVSRVCTHGGGLRCVLVESL